MIDINDIIDFLKSLKEKHYYTEYDWESCPMSDHVESCEDDSCTCSADEINNKIDAFIKKLQEY